MSQIRSSLPAWAAGRFYTVLLSTILLLSACGGGSSGGVGGAVGTYLGPLTMTISAAGTSQTVTGIQQIAITPDGMVAVGDPGDPPVGTGTLSGNSFQVSVPASFANQPGIACPGAIVLNGTINGNRITGTVSSNQFKCNGVPFTLTGTFSAEKSEPASLNRSGRGAVEILRSTISSSFKGPVSSTPIP